MTYWAYIWWYINGRDVSNACHYTSFHVFNFKWQMFMNVLRCEELWFVPVFNDVIQSHSCFLLCHFYNWFIQNSISYLLSTQLCFFLNRAIFRFQVKIKDALHIFSFSFYAFNSILTYFICCFLMIYKCQCFFFSSNLHEKRFLSSCYMLSMQTFISKISHDSKTTFKWISIGFNPLW